MRETVVLREVYDRFDAGEEPVDVICEAAEGFQPQQVESFLTGIGAAVRLRPTDRYAFASLLSLAQAERIDRTHGTKQQCIRHVWLDKKVSAFVDTSQTTINAAAARTLFGCCGQDINWAVLDTGLDINHSWLKGNCSPKRQTDFTEEGIGDEVGHGTHVAGIIAKIAPKVVLHDYKVLGKGGGHASGIVRAMHEVRKVNFDAGKTVIHGVNLSLGGPVQVTSYGCGWSPECQEADRLVASGVVVCVAASNDGYKKLATVGEGNTVDVFPTYMDIGISDPGNAEEVITVGSTHRESPHTYGPSFFSSKGPTGDGRYKPDCLAPGEKIVSAKAGTPDGTVTMSGTSMATPHVSGAIALFLSCKREFIGRAREVKEILLASCTDLGRVREFQGQGLVDVLRMLQGV